MKQLTKNPKTQHRSFRRSQAQRTRAFHYCLECKAKVPWDQNMTNSDWVGILCSKCHELKTSKFIVFDRDKKIGKIPKNLKS